MRLRDNPGGHCGCFRAAGNADQSAAGVADNRDGARCALVAWLWRDRTSGAGLTLRQQQRHRHHQQHRQVASARPITSSAAE